jgi:hypothetical protein
MRCGGGRKDGGSIFFEIERGFCARDVCVTCVEVGLEVVWGNMVIR